ncbi:DUF5597 domain-containing protein [Microbacterium sp. NPDC089318]
MTTPIAPLRVELSDGTLLVDGRRTLLAGGELHNSGASTAREIDRALDAAAALGVEVVLAPISWDLWEPEEGVFDPALVDAMLTGIRSRGLRWIPLWFGSWKNGMSGYVPRWVTLDRARFPRLQTADGSEVPAITPFADAASAADATAFAALLAHIAVHGADVVVMVQVENEVGMLGGARDHGAIASAVWDQPVPGVVVDAVRRQGHGRLHEALAAADPARDDWEGLFGDEAAEAFMAAAYARYIESVAAAGRRHLDVPMLVNAWLDVAPESDDTALTGGVRAGDYPSGGPLRHTAPIWRALAPTIDILAPDIYVGDLDVLCAEYGASSGALLIPEMRCDAVGLGHMFRAVGEFGAIGVSPFAVDAVPDDDPDRERLVDGFRLLRETARLLARFPGARTHGFALDPDAPRLEFATDSGRVEVDGAHRTATFPVDPPAHGILLQTEEAWFVIGRGFAVRWLDEHGTAREILGADELEIGETSDAVLRRLNGDERGEWLRMPALAQRQIGSMPIRQNLRSSGVVRVVTSTT